MSSVDDYCRNQEMIMRRVQEENDKSKSENKLVGRLLSFSSGDGRAYYQISKVDGDNVHLKLIDVYDGYTSSPIEYMGRVVPMRLVTGYFAHQERWAILYGGV